MPRIPNITEISNPFEPAAEGNYDLVIEEAEDTVSQAGAEMLKLKLRITGAEDSANESHVGKTMYDYVVYGGAEPSNFALFRIRQYAAAAGVDPSSFDETELLNVAVKGAVRVREGNDGYPPSNQLARLLVDVDNG